MDIKEKSALRQEVAARVKEEKKANLKYLLTLPEFREFVGDFLNWSGAFSIMPQENANIMAYDNGKRAAGIKIFGDICLADDNAFATIRREAFERENGLKKEMEKLIINKN